MDKSKYFDLIFKDGDNVHLVYLTEEQLEKLNILINVLDEITVIKEPFAVIKMNKKEENTNV